MATPVSPTPDTQDPHPPVEARGWTQQHKKKTVSVLDLYNQLNQSNAVRDTYRMKLDVTQKPSPAQPSPAQPSPAQPSPAQPSPAQPSPAQPSPAQPSPAQPSPAQPSPAQPSPAQPSPAQPSPAQPSPAQPSPAQPSPAQPSPAQPSPAQPSPAQPSPAQPSPAPLNLANRSKSSKQHHPILAKAAQRLLSAHASTAAARRNWSMWGHTYHNALRNKFSVEAAKREVYLKANVPTTDSDDDTPAVPLIDIMN
ncbi:hypothetical protein QJQ45_004673 [Haematococcus lacustris]|nr:hypothetical protein QJQ45_004673 [Haematococcus lacustris]